MTATPDTKLTISKLSSSETHEFLIVPDAEDRAAIAKRFGLSGLRKLRFEGALRPEGRTDWALVAKIGATVVQPCVVTLAPVTTRIDDSVSRTYLAVMPDLGDESEVEMPEDDSIEQLPKVLDLAEVMEEALALALPLYPRADGAEIGSAQFAEDGIAPMTDEDTKPFASLSALKNKLETGQKDE